RHRSFSACSPIAVGRTARGLSNPTRRREPSCAALVATGLLKRGIPDRSRVSRVGDRIGLASAHQEVRMDSQAGDAVEFRAGQRRQWQKGAKGWRKWSDFIDAATAPVSTRMVELAQIGPGSRVLDVAAGYGEPSLTAAAVAGPEGKVVATDISAEMLQYGSERAAAAGLENITFVESAAASLDFPAESFDAA